MAPRSYAVGVLVNDRVELIVRRRLSLGEAARYARVHNRLAPGEPAVILLHPLSRVVKPTSQGVPAKGNAVRPLVKAHALA